VLTLAPGRSLREVLCIGAHSDDIEIGCGGTVHRLLAEHPGTRVRWVVLSGEGGRAEEARVSAKAWLADARTSEVTVEAFPDRFFPWHGEGLKSWFAGLAARCRPDVVLTHFREDLHQDHRTVAELTWNAFRDQLVLEFEIPKWDGDLGRPNVYVPLDRATCERKVQGLLDGFASQRDRDWFTADTFWALLRLRGLECRSPSGFAEAFHARKVVL
jgi:LmbE family N-acetylglucosaminyl deacetylase